MITREPRPAAEAVRRIILSTWPGRFTPGQLGEDQALGAEGLGLDSIELVELIMACEEACGTSASEALFATAPLTIARVIADLRATA